MSNEALRLADAYADASFDQGLHRRTEDPAPEKAREELAAFIRRQHALIAELAEALEWSAKALVHHTSESQPAAQKARAVLSKAKEQQ